MSYDDPNATVQREISFAEIGGAATTAYAKFRAKQKGVLKNIHLVVTTAGTTDAHAFEVVVGAGTVATMTCGTQTAGSIISLGDTEQAIGSLELLQLISKADGDGTADAVYEYSVDHDATHTE